MVLQVEEMLRDFDNVCVLRVRMPISSDLSNPRNFITKIARYSKVRCHLCLRSPWSQKLQYSRTAALLTVLCTQVPWS